MALEKSPKIPIVMLSSGHTMPVVALGTFDYNFEPQTAKEAVIEAIKAGYRHFDTASVYGSEGAVGEAIAEAVQLGLIGSRTEVFITSKLWCTDNHPNRVLPAIRYSLKYASNIAGL
ncbi:NAD(P)-linked oxidoreductase superfamily protein [Rhynchospora pubera]|uniref:NAD(P)-linked oxidoreductase superfamily protein n=1 Tax=Rhynchospora pubera TaxID=906938 RepID=A0AAV8FLE5_9POAL|nr:NAD(P)-linked oxidoreductase superfamily protein [Rhynchospora pubera]